MGKSRSLFSEPDRLRPIDGSDDVTEGEEDIEATRLLAADLQDEVSADLNEDNKVLANGRNGEISRGDEPR